ncbi:Gfo/Idh/MocA family protein [Gorillibacterium timonense]|uniref:Gfo/Idh/MocA family protein n=1 Tax=Gorillibacterium timonense TaxID=1689269 RepID=UPI00071DE138|nr:Gfo/Idh/MocA family oxidoreductase [Gorillibacterium timonense]
MGNTTVKWGILGAGWISGKFVRDLAYAEGAEVAAVAARSLSKAEEFAAEHSIPRAYGSYEELAQDPEVDIVYIGTIHPAHKENLLLCLKAGKSVLCEKPFTMTAAEAEVAARAAEENGAFLMEAMWTRFLPPIRKVREWLRDEKIGEVRLLKADFGFDAGWNPEGRLLNPDQGGGALMDAGIYPISFASYVFGQQPKRIESTVRIGETGVDEHFSLLFDYEGGKSAALNGAVRLAIGEDAWIVGTKGRIYIPKFLYATSATLFVDGEDPVEFHDERSAEGYCFEAEEAMACLRAGKRQSSVMPLAETVAIMETLDAIRGQWKLTYPFEKEGNV